MILFTADWHIKLGQKNVPLPWACTRYEMFFEQVHDLEKDVDLHIIGGDLFDRVPSMDELTLYFDFVKGVTVRTIIFDGNHEATRKNKTFFTNLKKVTEQLNSLVTVIDETTVDDFSNYAILPYADLHRKNSIEDISSAVLFTHVRGEIPPHVQPEVDLSRFDKFKVVFAGDLHAHSNTQRNIVYPGSPMTTSFHRNNVETGYLMIDDNDGFQWTWHTFDLPQLIRKTVTDPSEMVQTEFDHTIYEIEGDVSDLSNIKNSELLDKKVIKRKTEATLILGKEMTMEEELGEYLSYILELDDSKVKNILGVFSDYAKEVTME
jgi:DNA repair exonuclease SbcCD nuclease subunit